MTISTTTRKDYYAVTVGVTTYPYTFKIQASAQLVVYLEDTDGVLNKQVSGYSVTGVGVSSGGSVVFDTAPDPDVYPYVLLRRETPLTQETDYTEGDAFPAEAHEGALDKLTQQAQETAEDVARAVKTATAAGMINLELPEPVAGKAIKWNATADGLENSDDDPDAQAALAAAQVALAAAQVALATAQANAAAGSAGDASDSADDAAAQVILAQAEVSNCQAQVLLAAAQVSLATGQATAAGTSATLAGRYATYPEDSLIPGTTDYSAYHWYKKALAAASGGQLKCSSDDTTLKYLEDAITLAASSALTKTTTTGGANEHVQFDVSTATGASSGAAGVKGLFPAGAQGDQAKLVTWALGALAEASQAEAEAGSVQTAFMTPLRVAQAIAALAAGLKVKVKTFTRATDASAGNVSYTGVGFQPKAIVFIAVGNQSNGQPSFGLADSSTGNGIAGYGTTSLTWANAGLVVWWSDAANNQSATVASMDADGFTLTWNKTGTPGSYTINVTALCIG